MLNLREKKGADSLKYRNQGHNRYIRRIPCQFYVNIFLFLFEPNFLLKAISS